VTDSRENEIKLRLNDAELAQLDELRGGVRAAFARCSVATPRTPTSLRVPRRSRSSPAWRARGEPRPRSPSCESSGLTTGPRSTMRSTASSAAEFLEPLEDAQRSRGEGRRGAVVLEVRVLYPLQGQGAAEQRLLGHHDGCRRGWCRR
jgi:hypothetical protein